MIDSKYEFACAFDARLSYSLSSRTNQNQRKTDQISELYTCDVLLVRVCVSIIRHSLSESYYIRTLRCLNVPHALYTNNAFFTNLRFTHVVFRHCIQGNYIVIETSYFFLSRYRSSIVIMENGNGFWTTKKKKKRNMVKRLRWPFPNQNSHDSRSNLFLHEWRIRSFFQILRL